MAMGWAVVTASTDGTHHSFLSRDLFFPHGGKIRIGV
jgi:hypothetical protein